MVKGKKIFLYDQQGFTLVELTIVTILSSLALIAMSSFFASYYQDTLTAQQSVRVNTGASLEAQIISKDIITAEAAHLRDPSTTASGNALFHQQANDWTYNFDAKMTNPAIPSITGLIYDGSQGNPPSKPLFLFALTTYSINSSGFPIINLVTDYPYTDVIIYYIQSGSMYRRTVANTAADGSVRKTTCRGVTGCPSDAKVIEDGIASAVQSVEMQPNLKYSPAEELYFKPINFLLIAPQKKYNFFGTTYEHIDAIGGKIGGAAL